MFFSLSHYTRSWGPPMKLNGGKFRRDLFILLIAFIFRLFSSKESKTAYIILLLSILSSRQQPCEVGWAENLWLAQSHPVSFMAKWRLEPGSPESQSNTLTTIPFFFTWLLILFLLCSVMLQHYYLFGARSRPTSSPRHLTTCDEFVFSRPMNRIVVFNMYIHVFKLLVLKFCIIILMFIVLDFCKPPRELQLWGGI